MMIWLSDLPYFSMAELACKCPCQQVKLDIRFAAALPMLRQEWGQPLTLNSVCRCPTHNNAVGGKINSYHLTANPAYPVAGTMAADIRWHDWAADKQRAFATLALARDWSVGLHQAFVHVDRRHDTGKAKTVFLYGEWLGAFGPADIKESKYV